MRVSLVISVPDTATKADVFKAVRRAYEGDNTILEPNTSSKQKGVRITTKGGNVSAARKWARAKGYDVGARGKLPQEILDAYAKA